MRELSRYKGDWCSDSTDDFDSSSKGLNPLSPAMRKVAQLAERRT